jgi:hypothetical protein
MKKTSKINLVLALQQVENISNLVRENNYEAFFTSHLLPIKFEIERQIVLYNDGKEVL